MGSISQFFALSGRGDTILSKEFRGDVRLLLAPRPCCAPHCCPPTLTLPSPPTRAETTRAPPPICRPFTRAQVPKGTNETFFRKVKLWKGEAPPVFNVDGINYLYVKKNGIFFVATTKFNVSPSFILELLERVSKVFKDYCGVLSEESIRKNFILLYELLDEMLVRFGPPAAPPCARARTLGTHRAPTLPALLSPHCPPPPAGLWLPAEHLHGAAQNVRAQ